jgi:hypothetical protein
MYKNSVRYFSLTRVAKRKNGQCCFLLVWVTVKQQNVRPEVRLTNAQFDLPLLSFNASSMKRHHIHGMIKLYIILATAGRTHINTDGEQRRGLQDAGF